VGTLPLHDAVRKNDLTHIEQLLDQGYDVNQIEAATGITALDLAATSNRLSIVNLLLSRGADPNLRNRKENDTPLHSVTSPLSSVEVAELLISNGADVNAQTKSGSTPLTMAIANRLVDFVRLFLSRGANTELKNDKGHSALHTAVYYYCFWQKHGGVGQESSREGRFSQANTLLDLLLANGADLNSQDKLGNTPLHTAVLYERDDMVELLVTRGADINIRNQVESVPHDVAIEKGLSRIAEFLRRNGNLTS
jgi:ankyrin repeat protein